MKKKVIALMVAGACTAPLAFAQSSNVQLYGRANLGFDQYEAKGSGLPGRDMDGRFRVFNNSSRVGLRGTEDLGNGLKAIFQIETGVAMDNGSNTGQGGQPSSASGLWASRDSFVGLDSNFGRVTIGRHSGYRLNGPNAQFSGNYINTEIPWTSGLNLGRVSSGPAGANMVVRANNSIKYTTPQFAGMTGQLTYSPNAQETVQGNTTFDTDGVIWEFKLSGRWGPIYAQGDYMTNDRNSNKNGTPRAEADLYKLGASWGYMPGARVGLVWARTATNNAAGLTVGDKVHADAWSLNWEHTIGNVQLMGQYGQLGSMKGCDTAMAGVRGSDCSDTKAKAWMVGARYLLSKRTSVYASYNQIDNGQNNFADYTSGGITSTNPNAATSLGVPYGADPRIIAVGLLHHF